MTDTPTDNKSRKIRALRAARRLQSEIQECLSLGSFVNDDVLGDQYNAILLNSLRLFPNEPLLLTMETMPDDLLRSLQLFGIHNLPSDFYTKRLDSWTKTLVYRLEDLIDDEEELAEADEEAESERTVYESTVEPEILNFHFVPDPELRRVLALDYLEAQSVIKVGAFKAAAILLSAIIEGILLGSLKGPDVTKLEAYGQATSKFRKDKDKAINWDRVGLKELFEATSKLGIVSSRGLALAETMRDFRDTVHPNAEVRSGERAKSRDVDVLLAIVRFLHDEVTAYGESNEVNSE